MNFEDILLYLTTKQAITIYGVAAFSAFVENIFPPYPSDTIILAAAFLAGQGNLSYLPLFLTATIGGLSGAMLLYYLGKLKGRSYFTRHNKLYLKVENLQKIERWFHKWGSLVLVVSRFMAGVRSVIAIAAGIGGVRPVKMTILTFISFSLWYGFLLGGMYLVKSNWQQLVEIIKSFNYVLVIVSAVLLTIWLVIVFLRSKAKQ